MTPNDVRQYHLGLLLVAMSAVAWSTAGYFVRLVPVDVWTMLFWRAVFGGLFIFAFAVCLYGGKTLRMICSMDRYAWFVTLCSTGGMIVFIPALKLTTVANVAIVFATVPFVAAGLAWFWLRERPSGTTLLASTMALGGVAVMVGGSSMAGSRLGDLLAFVMTLTMATMMVTIRRHRSVPILPMACVSNFLAAIVVLPFAAPFEPTSAEIGYLALFGLVQMSLGLTLFSLGSRLVPSAQAGLVSAVETPLAPLWVWIAFGEMPAVAAIAGGGIVMAAVIGHFLLQIADFSQMQPRSWRREDS